MSNIGIHYYLNVDDISKTKSYITNLTANITNGYQPKVIFKLNSNSVSGIINWGLFGGYNTFSGTNIIFDGYLLDKYKLSKEEQLQDIYEDFISQHIDFIKNRNFIGNLVIETSSKIFVISSQHTIFYLFYYYDSKTNLFAVAPAPKFIIPYIKHFKINKDAIKELMQHEHCLNNKIIIKDINRLAPNTILMYNKQKNILVRYNFSKFYWHNTPKVELTNNAKKDSVVINKLFHKAVEKSTYLFRNQELNLSFSGGTDSSYFLSHLLELGFTVNLRTLMTDDIEQSLNIIFNRLKHKYRNQVVVDKIKYPQHKLKVDEIIAILNNRIDLRECSSRLYGDWHVYYNYLKAPRPFCFSDSNTGDVVIGATKVSRYNKILNLCRAYIPNFFLNTIIENLFSKKNALEDFYQSSSIQNTKDYSFLPSNILVHDVIFFENRMYNYTNDICHMNRNYGEYFLSPFLENNFFRIVMQYPYKEKINHKMYYYLLREQKDYFFEIPTDNIGTTLPNNWYSYKVKRFNPISYLYHRFINKTGGYSGLSYIALRNENIVNRMNEDSFISIDKILRKLVLDLYIKRLNYYRELYFNTYT